VNMELNEHVEPGQAGGGKEKHASTPVSQIGNALDFMNVVMQVGSNPEVEIPKPPGWTNCEENFPEAKVTITETFAFGKEERTKASPLEIL
jgi:hypothetical protein